MDSNISNSWKMRRRVCPLTEIRTAYQIGMSLSSMTTRQKSLEEQRSYGCE
ncbi:unnamed protein product [Amoebophrya sp. A25]|nr:unnamed protein product [Amoebophrya sp. A25]|eukprot:GSA25T00027746001.1